MRFFGQKRLLIVHEFGYLPAGPPKRAPLLPLSRIGLVSRCPLASRAPILPAAAPSRRRKVTATVPSTWRFFVWLLATLNLLTAFGYLLYSGIGGIGDWTNVIDGVEWNLSTSPTVNQRAPGQFAA
jgi:hypothetical protein